MLFNRRNINLLLLGLALAGLLVLAGQSWREASVPAPAEPPPAEVPADSAGSAPAAAGQPPALPAGRNPFVVARPLENGPAAQPPEEASEAEPETEPAPDYEILGVVRSPRESFLLVRRDGLVERVYLGGNLAGGRLAAIGEHVIRLQKNGETITVPLLP